MLKHKEERSALGRNAQVSQRSEPSAQPLAYEDAQRRSDDVSPQADENAGYNQAFPTLCDRHRARGGGTAQCGVGCQHQFLNIQFEQLTESQKGANVESCHNDAEYEKQRCLGDDQPQISRAADDHKENVNQEGTDFLRTFEVAEKFGEQSR